MLSSIIMFGQNRDGHRSDSRYSYNGYYNYSSTYSSDYGRQSNTRRNKGNRYVQNTRFDRLSYRDQKRMKNLWHDLERQERKAWRDGHLSRRERKCLNNIKRDIDRIWSKYERRNTCGGRNNWG